MTQLDKLQERERHYEAELAAVRKQIEMVRGVPARLDGKVAVLKLYSDRDDNMIALYPTISIGIKLSNDELEALREQFTWPLGHADGETLVLAGPKLDTKTVPNEWRRRVFDEVDRLRQLGVSVRRHADVSLLSNMINAAKLSVDPLLSYVQNL